MATTYDVDYPDSPEVDREAGLRVVHQPVPRESMPISGRWVSRQHGAEHDKILAAHIVGIHSKILGSGLIVLSFYQASASS